MERGAALGRLTQRLTAHVAQERPNPLARETLQRVLPDIADFGRRAFAGKIRWALSVCFFGNVGHGRPGKREETRTTEARRGKALSERKCRGDPCPILRFGRRPNIREMNVDCTVLCADAVRAHGHCWPSPSPKSARTASLPQQGVSRYRLQRTSRILWSSASGRDEM